MLYPAYFHALASSEAIVADDAHSDPRTCEFSATYLTPLGINAMMDIPVHVHGRLEGVLCHEQVGPPTPWMLEDRLFSIAIANLIALALEQGERCRTEAALRESEARFRTLADSLPVMVWVADPEGRCTWFNKTWLDYTGRTLDQEIGYGWTHAVHPADVDDCRRSYEKARQARVPFTLEYRVKGRDGAYRWILDSGGPRFQPGGELAGFIGGCLDITDRKRVEEEARSREVQIHRLAYHDALTELPNRVLLLDRLGQALAQAERDGGQIAVLYIDLDRFKGFSWDFRDPFFEDVGWNFSFQPMKGRFQDTIHSLHRKIRSQKEAIAVKAIALQASGKQSMALDFRDPLEKFTEAFAKLLPGKTLEPVDEQSQTIRYRTEDTVLPLTSLSSGEKEVVTIVFDFLLRDPRDCIIVFDEPELHRHPELSYRLLRTLREVGERNQFIFSNSFSRHHHGISRPLRRLHCSPECGPSEPGRFNFAKMMKRRGFCTLSGSQSASSLSANVSC